MKTYGHNPMTGDTSPPAEQFTPRREQRRRRRINDADLQFLLGAQSEAPNRKINIPIDFLRPEDSEDD